MKHFAYDIEESLRASIVADLRKDYERHDPKMFEQTPQGTYPDIGLDKTIVILDWIHPAMHLTLEPRPGREAADRALARKMIIRAILQGQHRQEGHPADGLFHWKIKDGENPYPGDRNTPGFMGCGLVRIWDNDPQKLADWPERDFALFKDAVKRSAAAALRHCVRVGYINPQCLDFYLGYVAADLLGLPEIRERTREHMIKFIAYANMAGSFEEWIGPNYMAVNLTSLVPLAHYVKGTDDEKMVSEILDFQWRLIGAAAHGPTREICGPHSRAYGDTAFEMADKAYAWLHLAAPEVFTQEPVVRTTTRNYIENFLPKNHSIYNGLAAPGLYAPLQVPEGVRSELRSSFQTSVEGRENFEWIGGPGWTLSADLSLTDLVKPAEPAPRFRLGTRYRASSFCVGSVNELDSWLQRRPCLAYWKDADGLSTGLKWHVKVDAGSEAGKFLGDWLFMEAIEFVSVQSGSEVLGAYRTAPVVSAQPGERLQASADIILDSVLRGGLKARRPVGWFLGTHWRQSIEPEWQKQKLARLWIGITPVGKGCWTQLDERGQRWSFSENGIEAVLETLAPTRTVSMSNLTANNEPVNCLELWAAVDLDWNWLDMPKIFLPFGLQVHTVGSQRKFGLRASGGPNACEIEREDLRMKWVSPTRPDEIHKRTWWGWKSGREILPDGYAM